PDHPALPPLRSAYGSAPGRQRDPPISYKQTTQNPTAREATSSPRSGASASRRAQKLVRLAKMRFRVEQDYRELKDALGLDHFEGRSYPGWNHHVTLVSVAHAFLTLERRRRPPARAAA